MDGRFGEGRFSRWKEEMNHGSVLVYVVQGPQGEIVRTGPNGSDDERGLSGNLPA